MSVPSEPEGFPYHPWYRLARRRLSAAAEVPANQPDRRAWVRVTPRDESDGHIVTYYEVQRDRYEEACETWDWDLLGLELNKQQAEATDDVELMTVLRRWLPDLSELKDPALTGMPW